MSKRNGLKWGLALALIMALASTNALAQGPGGGRGAMRGGPEMIGRMLCDVEGLWFTATFEAKLDAAALEKLKPVCQKAADARKSEIASAEMGNPRERALAVKAIGDEMVKGAKTALGDNAPKLEPWFKKREETMTMLENSPIMNGGARGPQPTPVPNSANPAPAAPPAPGTPAPTSDVKKEEKK